MSVSILDLTETLPEVFRYTFTRLKPEFFNVSNMVEVQIGFQVFRVGRSEYVFVPKLRSLCLLNRAAEKVS